MPEMHAIKSLIEVSSFELTEICRYVIRESTTNVIWLTSDWKGPKSKVYML